jgi:hypothetical protein
MVNRFAYELSFVKYELFYRHSNMLKSVRKVKC